ncbi:MAG: DUF1849 family protein [Sneathiella sp.]
MKKQLIKNFAATVTILGILLPQSLAFADAIPLASYKAVYDLSLRELKRDGGIQNVRGRIVMQVENGCEGYVLNQRMLVELSNTDGGTVVSDYHLSTWEDKVGDLMRFSMSNVLNGKEIEKFNGTAAMKNNGADGLVTFKDQEVEAIVLPKGVLFPTAHTRAILKSAKAGKNLVSAKIYDGNGKDGLQDSLTVIGKKNATSAEMAKRTEMVNIPFWPVQLAYFDLSEQTNEPDYEVGLKMYENGIVDGLVLKYKDFSMNGKLVQLDFIKISGCSKQ